MGVSREETCPSWTQQLYSLLLLSSSDPKGFSFIFLSLLYSSFFLTNGEITKLSFVSFTFLSIKFWFFLTTNWFLLVLYLSSLLGTSCYFWVFFSWFFACGFLFLGSYNIMLFLLFNNKRGKVFLLVKKNKNLLLYLLTLLTSWCSRDALISVVFWFYVSYWWVSLPRNFYY